MNSKKLLTFGNFEIEFLTFGEGSNVILCFHGFGRQAEDFLVLQKSFKKHFKVYAINIFHHGKSTYPKARIENNAIEKAELVQLFEAFTQSLSIDRFSVAGYSLGGKIALTLIEFIGERIEGLYLFAPDGIHINKWYKFAANNAIGKGVFKWVNRHPQTFFALLKFSKGIRLISPRLYRWTYLNMQTAEIRALVYAVWMSLRHIEPNIEVVKKQLNKHQVQTELFFGKYDQVIPTRIGKDFINGLTEAPVSLHICEAGHMVLNEATDAQLAKLLTTKKGAITK